MSQTKVAAKAGTNMSYYSIIKRSEVNSSVGILIKILNALRIRLTLLLK
jgi:transcriptional regulator with XRE-family HTH domain